MDQNEHKKSLTQYFITSPIFQKKITQLLLSISVFSLLISYYSWYSFLLQSFHFYFIAFPLKLLTHALDKSYIFLIFNGILVVLAKTSGFSPSEFDLKDHIVKKIEDSSETSPLVMKESLLEEESPVERIVPQDNADFKEPKEEEGIVDKYVTEEGRESANLSFAEIENANSSVQDEAQEVESDFINIGEVGETGRKEEEEETKTLCIEYEQNENEQVNDSLFEGGGGGEEEEEGGNELLSTEELNKKFDDFIRKMKQEIRMEVQQQQLVMVG